MQPNLYTVARESLNVVTGVSLNVDPDPISPPVAKAAKAANFFALLWSNLHAAALHAAMGHEGSRFQECPRPACLDAAQLIPPMEEIEPGATDAELAAILDQALAEEEASLLETAMVQ